ncbi:MAG: hypothetical protein V2A72_06165 [Candidatus Omnitrophota bacterium]
MIFFLNKLKNHAVIVKEFSPYYDGGIRFRYDSTDTTALPVTTDELFARKLMGPCLTIYEVESR